MAQCENPCTHDPKVGPEQWWLIPTVHWCPSCGNVVRRNRLFIYDISHWLKYHFNIG